MLKLFLSFFNIKVKKKITREYYLEDSANIKRPGRDSGAVPQEWPDADAVTFYLATMSVNGTWRAARAPECCFDVA